MKLAKWSWCSGEEHYFIVSMYFRYAVFNFLEKRMTLYLNKFLNFVNGFLIFRYYIPLKKDEPFNGTNLNPLFPSILCVKFGLNRLSRSGEDDGNVKTTDRRTDRLTDDG